MIRYRIGVSGQSLIIKPDVLAHFDRFRQRRFWQRESGGQLFATIDRELITVEEATGPRASDRRGRVIYVANRAAEQQEINDRHAKGLHFVGDWHTHPEEYPNPSPIDLASLADCFTRSHHGLNAFVLVIVGRSTGNFGLHVSLHDGVSVIKLEPNSRSE